MSGTLSRDSSFIKISYATGESLTLDRTEFHQVKAKLVNSVQYYFDSIYGVFQIGSSLFLGFFNNTEILTKFLQIKLSKNLSIIPISKTFNKNSLNLLQNAFKHFFFYYSFETDVTLTTQSRYSNEKKNNLFCFNYVPRSTFISLFCGVPEPPKISVGFIEYISKNVLLMVRRSRMHVGSNYWKSGVDKNGYSSNFWETETLVYDDENVYSFVTHRGSIPVYWSRNPPHFFSPILHFGSSDECLQRFQKHIAFLNENYGKIHLINLLRNEGQEKLLSEALKKCVDSVNKCSMETAGLNVPSHIFQNTLNLLPVSLSLLSYFHAKNGEIVQRQSIFFRINCLSSVDRSNFVSSVLAWHFIGKLPHDTTEIQFMEAAHRMGDVVALAGCGSKTLYSSIYFHREITRKNWYFQYNLRKRKLIAYTSQGFIDDSLQVASQENMPYREPASTNYLSKLYFVLLFVCYFFAALFKKTAKSKREANFALRKVISTPQYSTTIDADLRGSST